MRSRIHGTFATLLLMVPVLSIPALAIFGIPKFAPVVSSPLDEGADDDDPEHRIGQSARLGDFPTDLEDAPAFDSATEFGARDREPRMGESVSIHKPPRGQAGPRNSRPGESRPLRDATDAFNRPGAFADPLASNRLGWDSQPDRSSNAPRQPDLGLGEPAGPLHGSPLNSEAQPNAPAGFENARPLPPNGNPEPLTWAIAIRRLKELQIRDFRLGPGLNENEFIFVCSLTPNEASRVSYRFEAEAAEPLQAVENVLEQVVTWQQRRR